MFTEKELGHLLLAVIILTFIVSFKKILGNQIDYLFFLISFIFLALITLINVIAKKAAANYFESNLEIKIWEWQRFGFRREQQFKKPIPMGIIAPFIISFLTLGSFFLFTPLESNVEGTTARASKRHGKYRFTELTDMHMGIIISSGVIANLILAIIAYLINLGELAKWNIYFAAFSLIPFGNLDGMKIFMGKKEIWFTLAIITMIFLSYALFLP